jgi:hypothetical protein
MYGIDKKISYEFLIGKELLQLCIGRYQLIFNFSDQLVISTECCLSLKFLDGTLIEVSSDSPESAGKLTCLLGRTIENVNTDIDGVMTLLFAGGLEMSIIDSSKDEESFAITIKGQEIVV